MVVRQAHELLLNLLVDDNYLGRLKACAGRAVEAGRP
jgi:hypothetical protein